MMAKFVWLKADADFSYFYAPVGTPGGEYVLATEAGGMSTHSCNKQDYHYKVKQLEERIEVLEAERDRLKEENGNMDSMYQDRLFDMEAKVNLAEENLVLYAKSYDANVEGYRQDISDLRTRHAALVEAASKVCLCRMNYSKRGVNPALDEYAAMMQSITELADVVKAALAEVKP